MNEKKAITVPDYCLRAVAVLLLGGSLQASALADHDANHDVVPVGRFSAGELSGWQEQEFNGTTTYTLVISDARRVLQAQSQATASGLYRKIKVDLTATPFLNWSWQVVALPQSEDELGKAGDDFAARVYVVASGGALFWQTRSLVYVWAARQPPNSSWLNPYTGQARHIAVRSGTERLGRWLVEKRNVRADFARVFGEDIAAIDAVAIMTDSDNSGSGALARYGDIYFSKR